MTDPLEKYRVMVRSIKFSPSSLDKNQPTTQVEPDSVSKPSPSTSLSWAKISSVLDSGPPVDPSEHIADLVRNAVSKHTVLPSSYAIPANIADRISQLSPTREVRPTIILPPIPEPDPNWKPSISAISPVPDVIISEKIAAISPVPDVIISEKIEEITEVPDVIISEKTEEIISEKTEEITEVTEEETETLVETVEKHSPILEIICPKCGSHNSRKNGFYKDKQRYACKDCGKQFVYESQEIITEIKPAKTQTKESKTKGGFSGKSDNRSSKNKKKGKR